MSILSELTGSQTRLEQRFQILDEPSGEGVSATTRSDSLAEAAGFE
jgi:hypothetical protein